MTGEQTKKMFPQNSPFHKTDEQQEFERTLRERALSKPVSTPENPASIDETKVREIVEEYHDQGPQEPS